MKTFRPRGLRFDDDTQTGVPLTLQRTAVDQGIGHRTVDANTLIVTADALCQLVDCVPHYNLHAFDWRAEQTEFDLIANVLETSDHDLYRGGPVLPRLSKASLFLDSHDDCHLLLESYDLSLLKAVFARALGIYAATVLAQDVQFEGEIAEVPEAVVDEVWPDDSSLTILRHETIVVERTAHILASTPEDTLRQNPAYRTASEIEYDFLSEGWSVHSR